MGGTYAVLVAFAGGAVTFGAAGDRSLAPGTYVYVGSAHGPGGFSRVDRHRRTARGEQDVRHWHIDHLLGHPAAGLAGVVTRADVDVECAVAQSLAELLGPVEGVGASDCDCETHLLGPGDDLRATVEAAFDGTG